MSNALLDRLKKQCRIKEADVLSASAFFKVADLTSTSVPMLNVALSGSLDGGLASGLTIIAGPSKNFKTSYSLLIASAYLKKHKDAILMFYDTEFGSPQAYFSSFGIDTSRVLHIPIKNIEELKFDLINQLEQIERKDKVIIIIDSLGNIASKKELDDALNEKSVADMSRAKALKGLFRMATPYLSMNDIPMIGINHTYQTQEMFSKTVMSGGCFEEGTLIRLADGTNKAIDEIVVGDIVITRDGPRDVTHTWNPDTLEEGNPDCLELTFENGASCVCSDTHPFSVNSSWVQAQDLNIDDNIDTIDGQTIGLYCVQPVGKKTVYDITVAGNHEYVLSNGVVVSNTGIYYSASTIWVIGRQQDKVGTEIQGYHFIINIEKSRYVKEKSKIPISVSWEGGIEKYSGLLDVAKELGYVKSEKVGWYCAYDPATQTNLTGNLRAAATMTKEFWEDAIFAKTDFATAIKNRYTIALRDMLTGDKEPTEDDDSDE